MCVYISQLQPSAQGAQQARTRQRLEPRRPQLAFHALLGHFPPPLHPAAARCARRHLAAIARLAQSLPQVHSVLRATTVWVEPVISRHAVRT